MPSPTTFDEAVKKFAGESNLPAGHVRNFLLDKIENGAPGTEFIVDAKQALETHRGFKATLKRTGAAAVTGALRPAAGIFDLLGGEGVNTRAGLERFKERYTPSETTLPNFIPLFGGAPLTDVVGELAGGTPAFVALEKLVGKAALPIFERLLLGGRTGEALNAPGITSIGAGVAKDISPQLARAKALSEATSTATSGAVIGGLSSEKDPLTNAAIGGVVGGVFGLIPAWFSLKHLRGEPGVKNAINYIAKARGLTYEQVEKTFSNYGELMSAMGEINPSSTLKGTSLFDIGKEFPKPKERGASTVEQGGFVGPVKPSDPSFYEINPTSSVGIPRPNTTLEAADAVFNPPDSRSTLEAAADVFNLKPKEKRGYQPKAEDIIEPTEKVPTIKYKPVDITGIREEFLAGKGIAGGEKPIFPLGKESTGFGYIYPGDKTPRISAESLAAEAKLRGFDIGRDIREALKDYPPEVRAQIGLTKAELESIYKIPGGDKVIAFKLREMASKIEAFRGNIEQVTSGFRKINPDDATQTIPLSELPAFMGKRMTTEVRDSLLDIPADELRNTTINRQQYASLVKNPRTAKRIFRDARNARFKHFVLGLREIRKTSKALRRKVKGIVPKRLKDERGALFPRSIRIDRSDVFDALRREVLNTGSDTPLTPNYVNKTSAFDLTEGGKAFENSLSNILDSIIPDSTSGKDELATLILDSALVPEAKGRLFSEHLSFLSSLFKSLSRKDSSSFLNYATKTTVGSSGEPNIIVTVRHKNVQSPLFYINIASKGDNQYTIIPGDYPTGLQRPLFGEPPTDLYNTAMIKGADQLAKENPKAVIKNFVQDVEESVPIKTYLAELKNEKPPLFQRLREERGSFSTKPIKPTNDFISIGDKTPLKFDDVYAIANGDLESAFKGTEVGRSFLAPLWRSRLFMAVNPPVNNFAREQISGDMFARLLHNERYLLHTKAPELAEKGAEILKNIGIVTKASSGKLKAGSPELELFSNFHKHLDGWKFDGDGNLFQSLPAAEVNSLFDKAALAYRKLYNKAYKIVTGINAEANGIVRGVGLEPSEDLWRRLKDIQEGNYNRNNRSFTPSKEERIAAEKTRGMLNFDDSHDLSARYNEGFLSTNPLENERGILSEEISGFKKSQEIFDRPLNIQTKDAAGNPVTISEVEKLFNLTDEEFRGISSQLEHQLGLQKATEVAVIRQKIKRLADLNALVDQRMRARDPLLGIIPSHMYYRGFAETLPNAAPMLTEQNPLRVNEHLFHGILSKRYMDVLFHEARTTHPNIKDPNLASYLRDWVDTQRGVRGFANDRIIADMWDHVRQVFGKDPGFTVTDLKRFWSEVMSYQALTKLFLSARYPIVNMTQPLITTVPLFGMRNSMKALYELTVNRAKWIARAREAGVMNENMAFLLSEALPERARKFHAFFSTPAVKSEQLNRLYTFVTGVIAHENGYKPNRALFKTLLGNTADDLGVAAIDLTQFIVGTSNKPLILSGSSTFSRVPGQFKSFAINYASFMANLWKHDRKAFGKAVAAIIGLGGLPVNSVGLPLLKGASGGYIDPQLMMDKISFEMHKLGIPFPRGDQTPIGAMLDWVGIHSPIDISQSVGDPIGIFQTSGQVLPFFAGPTYSSIGRVLGTGLDEGITSQPFIKEGIKAAAPTLIPLLEGAKELQQGGVFSPSGKRYTNSNRTSADAWARIFNFNTAAKTQRGRYIARIQSAIQIGDYKLANSIMKEAIDDGINLTNADVNRARGRVESNKKYKVGSALFEKFPAKILDFLEK